MPVAVGTLATVIEDEGDAALFRQSASFDGVIGSMEAAFLCKSEEKHAHIATGIVDSLARINSDNWTCADCDAATRAAAQAAPPPPRRPPPPGSLCFPCRWRLCVRPLPPASLCRELLCDSVAHLQLAKRLEAPVKSFQRHNSTGAKFREDIGRSIDILIAADEEDNARIAAIGQRQQQRERPPASAKATDEHKEPQSHPQPQQHHNALYGDGDDEQDRTASAVSSWQGGVGLLRCVFGVCLLCCKFATENAPFNLRRSEVVKRKLRGLRLLLVLLQRAPNAFRSSRGGLMLVRRFVCPSLLTACITDVPAVFRLVLSVFVHLFDAYRSHLLIELGALVDMMFLPLLESPHCTLQQKRDIVEALAHTMLSSEQLVSAFYNYDNQLPTWKLFERIVQVLSRLCEGDVKYSRSEQQSSRHKQHTKRSELAADTADLSSLSAAATDSTDDGGLETLRKQAVRLLVHILHMQAQWCGIPGIERPDSLRSLPAALWQAEDDVQPSAAVSEPSLSSAGSSSSLQRPLSPSSALEPEVLSRAGSVTSAADVESALLIHDRLMERLVRNSTWMHRVDKQKAEARVVESALRLARTEGLRAACRFLKLVHPQTAWPREIAAFMFRQEGQLDKAEVGDVLSSSSDALLSKAEYDALRSHYLELLDFTGMSFDSALRAFLTSSGFRLPGEAQKIDRMLVAFSRSYCADNSDVFPNADAAFVLAFSLVLLNTDQHNAAMRSREPMTEQQFISNLRGVNNGQDFPTQLLSDCYHSVRDDEIAFTADHYHRQQQQHDRQHHHQQQHRRAASRSAQHRSTTSSSYGAAAVPMSHSESEPSSSSSSPVAGSPPSTASPDSASSGEESRPTGRQKAIRDAQSRSFIELLVRKSLAYLKNAAVQCRGVHRPLDSRLVLGMFDVSWLRCIAAITVTCETSSDVEVLHTCLDGLMYGSCLAVALRLPMERQAFTRVLAKLTFMERHAGTFSLASLLLNNATEDAIADCQRRLVSGEHLKQDWYRPLNLYAERQPLRAFALLQATSRETQRQLSTERRLQLVRQVQDAFDGDVRLVDNPHRALIRQGKLTKISASDGRRVLYSVFLFNDVLIYATAARQPHHFTFHRCLHLSLVRLVDLQHKPAESDRSAEHSSGSLLSAAAGESASTSFRIVSPQKSITLCAGSEDKKRQWVAAITAQMRLQLSKRNDYIQRLSSKTAAAQSEQTDAKAERAAAAAPDVSDELRRYSTFIGSDWSSSSTQQQQQQQRGSSSSPSFCKLCLRVFGLWRRRLQCDWCGEVVCQQCAQQKAHLPAVSSAPSSSSSSLSSSSGGQQAPSDADKVRLCDACVGVLNGSLSQQSTLVTVMSL